MTTLLTIVDASPAHYRVYAQGMYQDRRHRHLAAALRTAERLARACGEASIVDSYGRTVILCRTSDEAAYHDLLATATAGAARPDERS